MIVRTAVLKGKDPLQILAEMEKIDQMGKVKTINKYTCLLYNHCMQHIIKVRLQNARIYCLEMMYTTCLYTFSMTNISNRLFQFV